MPTPFPGMDPYLERPGLGEEVHTPDVPIPLQPGEAEPPLRLNQILHDLYDRAGYDLAVDYQRPPSPPLTDEDAQWMAGSLGQRTPTPTDRRATSSE
jgi:hypothetical protein